MGTWYKDMVWGRKWGHGIETKIKTLNEGWQQGHGTVYGRWTKSIMGWQRSVA